MIAELEQQLLDQDDMLKLLRANLTKAQDIMKSQSDLKRRELSFLVGDSVLLKVQPYRQKTLAKRTCEKFFINYPWICRLVQGFHSWGPVYFLKVAWLYLIFPLFVTNFFMRLI